MMSVDHDYLKTGAPERSLRIGTDVTLLMLKGAAYAAVFCIVIWVLFGAMYWVGKMLPEESRETEDPTPFSYYLNAPESDQA